jgi:hypothetical protein
LAVAGTHEEIGGITHAIREGMKQKDELARGVIVELGCWRSRRSAVQKRLKFTIQIYYPRPSNLHSLDEIVQICTHMQSSSLHSQAIDFKSFD